MPTSVVITLIATLAFALSVVFRVWGQEPDLHAVDIKAISMCGRALDNARLPCVVFSKPEEADVIYVAVFTPDGTEMQTIIRHDNASGKQAVVWSQIDSGRLVPSRPSGRAGVASSSAASRPEISVSGSRATSMPLPP